MPERTTLPFQCYTSSIIQHKPKLRLTATTVTNIAMCQFLWQRFDLASDPIFVVFPYVISLCAVCVGYRKCSALRNDQERLHVLLSDVRPNMMTAASGSDGKKENKEKELHKGRLTATNSCCSDGTSSLPLATDARKKTLRRSATNN